MLRPKALPKQPREARIPIGPWPHGLNISSDHGLLYQSEVTECLNWWILRGGVLESRPTIKRITTAPIQANPTCMYWYPEGEAGTLLLVGDNGVTSVLYRIHEGQPTSISNALHSSDVGFVPYKDIIIVCDGGYLKVLDPKTWTLKIAYDSGTGTRGYMYNGMTLNHDAVIQIHSGNPTRVAAKITTPGWPSAFTIPPVRMEAMLGVTGSPTGPVYARVRSVSNDTELAAVVIADASELPTTGFAKFMASFSSPSGQMSPESAYYVSIEYTGGNSSNYIRVPVETVANGGNAATYSAGSWTPDTTKNVMLALSPGLPPKARFGTVWNARPWIAGDPDAPGWLWFGNLSPYDWSTPNGGGHIGVVDDARTSFSVGAVSVLYGDMYVFGSPENPYLVRITGQTPDTYRQEQLFQHLAGLPKACLQVGNDIWCSNGRRFWSLSGVQSYGDVRALSSSDPVEPALEERPAHEAVYYPSLGGILALRSGTPYIMAVNTRAPSADPADQQSLRYPWCAWALYRADYADTGRWSWKRSVLGDDYYYLATDTGDPPSDLDKPAAILLDGNLILQAPALDDLTDLTWAWANADSLANPTVYLRQPKHPSDLYRHIHDALIPATGTNDDVTAYIAATDGYVYQFREPSLAHASSHLDLDTVQVGPIVKTGAIDLMVPSALLTKLWPIGHARLSATGIITIYQSSSIRSAEEIVPLEGVTFSASSSDYTINDLGNMLVSQATMIIVGDSVRLSRFSTHVYAAGYAIRVYITDQVSRAYLKGIVLVVRPLRY